MTAKEKILSVVKSPFFWVIISIIIVIVTIIFTGKSKKVSCLAGYSRGVCPDDMDKCVAICGPGQTYNCSSNQCECSSGMSKCGETECCPSGKCNNELCCETGRQCPGKDGKMSCCPDSQTCIDNKCVAMCGHGSDGKPIVCDGEDSYCLTVENATEAQLARLRKNFKDKVNVSTDGTAYICTTQPKCEMTNQTAAPKAQNNQYLCTNIFNGVDANGQIAYCTSNDASKAKACWEGGLSACGDKDNACTVRRPLETDVDIVNKDIEAIQGGHTYDNVKYLGNWCGQEGQYEFLSQEKTAFGSGGCTAVDCWKSLSKPGVTDVNWDGEVCTTIATCKQGQPVQFQSGSSLSYCKGKQVNSAACQDPNHSCNDDGSITTINKKPWVAKKGSDGVLFECVQGTSSNASFATKLECTNHYCDKVDNQCCQKGFTYKEGKCYIDPIGVPGSDYVTGNPCTHGGTDPMGKCGPAWIGCTNNNNQQNKCSGRCYVAPLEKQVTPHCVCNGDTNKALGNDVWVNLGENDTSFGSWGDNMNRPQCVPGKNDTRCDNRVNFPIVSPNTFSGCNDAGWAT